MRNEFTGMLPGAVAKFEALLVVLENDGLNPRVNGGYSGHGDDDDLRTWGVVCNIACDDMAALAAAAANLQIEIRDDGSLAFTNGLNIDDFKTFRVGPDIELHPENDEEV